MLEIVDPSGFGIALAGTLLVGILIFLWLGRALGRRTLKLYGSAGAPGIGSLEAAVFALLGLMIAFTFSGALSRFDQRRVQVVDESNAIGTAWLRLDLLPASAQPQLRQAMRDYVDARIATYRSLPDVKAAQAHVVKSQALQSEIWKQTVAAVRLPGAKAEVDLLVVPAMNDMFDKMVVRIVATQLHPPMVIYAMLIALALASALLAGYQSAGEKIHDRLHQFGFAAVIAFTVYVILDIEYPRLGWIRIDAIDQLLVNVRAGMK
jgi:hypothetical protein